MKIPMRWLNEYTRIDLTPEEYARRMIMTGTAVEGWENTCAFTNVVVGKVLTCEMHPDSDHLHVCTVDVGGTEPLQIVCGAPNVGAGKLVCCALEGAQLPGGVTIKKRQDPRGRKLRHAVLRSRTRSAGLRLSPLRQ